MRCAGACSKTAKPANDDEAKAVKKPKAKKADARQRSMLLPLAGGAKAEGVAAKPPTTKRKRP